MILPGPIGLNIVGVYDRGVPNLERVVLRPKDNIELGRYFMFLARLDAPRLGVPIPEPYLWLGDETLGATHWVVVYTGPGERTWERHPDTGEAIRVLHWGHKVTVLNDPQVVPVLAEIGAIDFPPTDQGNGPAHGSKSG